MTALDYSVVGLVAFSVLLGWWRGLIYEVLSLLGWGAAYLVARLFAVDVAPYMPSALNPEEVRLVAAFALLFVATLIVSGIVSWLLSKLVKIAGLGWLDGFLGALFGVLRGGFLVLVLVLLAGMTGLPKAKFWREAQLSAPLEHVALQARGWLPAGMAQKVHFETQN
ncbi:MAG: CvpA family protein [Sideroxydans sp.]|nr:CvpA family protein [Sideroxydans sp.]